MKTFPGFFVKGLQSFPAGAAQSVHGGTVFVNGGDPGHPLGPSGQRTILETEKERAQQKSQKARQNGGTFAARPAVAGKQSRQKQNQRNRIRQRGGVKKPPVGQFHLHPVSGAADFLCFQADDRFLHLTAAGPAFGAGLRAGITDDGDAAAVVVLEDFAEFGHVRPPLSI